MLGDPALARKLERLASKRSLGGEAYQAELLATLDERIGKLKTRVI